ncbi:ankyrin repeat domain-containing protein [Rubripirellula reticaptiva]|uniref:Phosphocholine transferase AnkX n=1 Tax=Rubripirellula reticaptiva TaxID=2528013 RepID=A0A5C6F4R2_9BACT|nr:ankyrin repeat domain-containing protein [Rubripirellula reticaptiva]TWU55036.1 Phosphocholine transferase AnkX [Rubripirellula reticaptiva]
MKQTQLNHRCVTVFSASLFILVNVCGCGGSVALKTTNDAGKDGTVKDEVATSLDQSVASTDATKETEPAGKSSTVQYSDEAFRVAAHDGNIDVVRKALAAGTNVDAPDPDRKYTALLMAAYNGHSHVIKVLLEHGAEVDARDFEGKTPLMHAASGPFPDAVTMLVDAGANVNATETTEGFTALMTAAAVGEVEVVKILLDRGADPNVVDEDNDTAKNHAINSGKPETAALLP